LPLDKFPLTDWLGAEYRYQAGYNWKAGPVNIDDDLARTKNLQDIADYLDFKNTIQNNRENNVTGKVDLVKLYNKIKFLKELNTPPRPQTPARPTPGRPQAGPANRPATPAKADTVKSTPGLIKGFFRLLMSVRSVNATYSLSEGTILPGFTESPKFLGMDEQWRAPGWGFVLGKQDPGIRQKAAQNNWLTQTSSLTMPFSQIRNESLTLRANVEPSTDFKIQIDVKKEGTSSYQEIFRYDSTIYDPLNPLTHSDEYNYFRSFSPSRTGSYKISFMSIRTAFDRTNGDVQSNVFQKFEANVGIIEDRFQDLFGAEIDTVQDIVIPAFIAAYSGADPYTVNLSPFPKMPLPNWRIDYTGLNKIEALKEIFQSVTLSHSYQSSYSVVNYSNSLEFSDQSQVNIDQPIEDYNNRYFGDFKDGEFTPVYVISQVLISEQFAPLIGVNIRTKGRLTARADYKTKRDLALNISNAQVTELTSKDVSFELGYTKNNLKLPFRAQGRTIVLKNDVTFRMNVTVGDTRTIQRKIADQNTITNGNINFQLRPNISYVVNQKLTLQGYFERTINEPQITNSYPRATTRFGIQVRFSLAQ
jgi:cell surface protein SprA